MPKPIIFLAFANDRVDYTRYLRNLSKEYETIEDIFRTAQKQGLCEVKTVYNATFKKIADVFQDERYRDRIAVFHFGGHGDKDLLQLETSEGGHSFADSGGFVPFLAKQKGLKLVFLNACNTQDFARKLFDKGISAIGTKEKVFDDDILLTLIYRFYFGIAEKMPIERAYQEAENLVQSQFKNDIAKKYKADLVWQLWANPTSKNWQLKKDLKPLIFSSIAIFILLLAYPLYKYCCPDLPFTFTIKIKELTPNPNLPFESGKISLQIGDKTENLEFLEGQKEVIFKQIPPNLENTAVKMIFEAEGFVKIDSQLVLENNLAEIGIRRDESLARIFGTVKNSEGMPLGDVKISVQAISVLSNAEGKFELKIPFDKQLKKQRISAFKQGFQVWDYETPVNGEEVKMVLEK